MKFTISTSSCVQLFQEVQDLDRGHPAGRKMWTSRFFSRKNPKNEQMKTCQTSLDISWGVGELKGFRQTDTPKIPASFFISLQNIQSQIDYMDTTGENAHSGRLQTVTKNATWRSDDDRCVL